MMMVGIRGMVYRDIALRGSKWRSKGLLGVRVYLGIGKR